MEPQKPWLFVPSAESAQVMGHKSWLPPVVGGHPGLSLGTVAGLFPGGGGLAGRGARWQRAVLSGDCKVSGATTTDAPPHSLVSPCVAAAA